ncbi:MAG: branched-chain amino acid ABC transporter permease [Leucobacter sp.]
MNAIGSFVTGVSRRAPGAWSWLLLVLGGVIVLVLSSSMSQRTMDVLISLSIYIAGAVGWNIIGGMGGQFSLVHAAFVGAGSYMAIMVTREPLGLSAFPALLLSIAVGVVLSLIVGAFLFTLRGILFAIASLAVSMAILAWMTIWEFTGGSQNTSGIGSLVPRRPEQFLYAVAIVVVAIGISLLVKHSRFGLRLRSVRDDQEVADSLGVSPFWTKLRAMVISGGIMGAIGALIAWQVGSVEPFSAFSLDWTISFIVMAVIGGLGTVWGPVIGAVIIYYCLTVLLQGLPYINLVISGLLMIVLITLLPGGLLGGVRQLIERFRPAQRPAVNS